jgi:hypothetical protein
MKVKTDWEPTPTKKERPEKSWKEEVMQCEKTVSCSKCEKSFMVMTARPEPKE